MVLLTLLAVLRYFLSGIFLLAGITKLADQKGSRKSLIDFGVPDALAGIGSVLLPLAEIATAICLIPPRLAWYGAIGALVLLAAFILAISIALLRGRRPDCHCFGQLQSKPIGLGLVVRNLALAAIPGVLLYTNTADAGISLRLQSFSAFETVLLIVAGAGFLLLCFQSWLSFQLVQQGGRVLLRLDELEKQISGAAPQPQSAQPPAALPQGLPVGQPAPDFSLSALDGAKFALSDLQAGSKPLILLFTHPQCGPCAELLPEAARWQADEAAHFKLALISQGTVKENRVKLKNLKLHAVLLQDAAEVSSAYLANATPSAVLVRPDGRIGSSLAAGSEAIRTLVADTINESFAGLVSIAIREGEAAPPLVYPDLDGNLFSLASLRGTSTALLFWNPGCGYCQQMLTDVQAWEKRAGESGHKLVVISTGSVEENRKLGLKAPILLDQNFSAGRAFGVTGTPSALLLDSEARVISPVAVGRQQIMETVLTVRPAVSRS